jgi:4-hydroxythreonine-4-phosphate dehydrogenase
VPLREVHRYIEKQRILDATRLICCALQANGVPSPRVAVAGFNPHNGDSGTCGREELDVIAPAVAELQAQGLAVSGPYSPDTIFLRARDGELDAIVTMYHDQGQIALKLMGFSQGVTVQGGLPIPITTPAHGTAYDIAGRGVANPDALVNAFEIAVRMGRARLR